MAYRKGASALPGSVTAGKGSAAYQAHTYPTKVPVEAITPFIAAACPDGGIVLDPFAGSGMTGVAAALSGHQAVLSDIGVGACHLSRSHTRRVEPSDVLAELAAQEARWMRENEAVLYRVAIPVEGLMRHMVWSEVYACPSCEAETTLWDAVDAGSSLSRLISCAACGESFDRTRAAVTNSVPVEVVVAPASGGKLQHLAAGEVVLETSDSLERGAIEEWYPTEIIDKSREMYVRSALGRKSVSTVADFFATRPLIALSKLWDQIATIENSEVRGAFEFAFTNTAWHASRMRRFNRHGGQRPLTGTLFIPQLISEPNVFEVFRNQVRQVCRYYGRLPENLPSVRVRRSSATDLRWIDDDSIDYVFTDPPFGNNIHYADCNIVWESWLGDVTDNDAEIVVNKSRRQAEGGKSVQDYEDLLAAAFSEVRRVLKPEGMLSVVFHNSSDAIWMALMGALERAGFKQERVSIMDKGQRSQKGYKFERGELVPFYDLVLTFSPGAETRPAPQANAMAVALEAVRAHLAALEEDADKKYRALDYLYSLGVAEVIGRRVSPEGLSLRDFEAACAPLLDPVS